MVEIHLRKQDLSTLANPLSIEMWKEMCRFASDEELRRLKLGALESLHIDGHDQHWSVYVSIVQETMRDRGIKP